MAATVYNTPDDVVELLDRILQTALRTRFYRSALGGQRAIRSLSDFESLPITPIAKLRRQAPADVIADPDRVSWIFGRYLGRRGAEVAVAEGADETALRYAIFRDALKDVLPVRKGRTGVVLTTPERRYFAAEVGTMLGYAGIATHVFTNRDRARASRMIGLIQPDVLALLSGEVRDADVPPPRELCITIRRSPAPAFAPQMDLYLVDELGFLGHSTDRRRWMTYNDQYYYEVSGRGRLVVTALRNRTFPLLRIETEDEARLLDEHHFKIGRLAH